MTRAALVGLLVTAGAVAAAVSHDVERLPWRRALLIPGDASGWIELREDHRLAARCRPDFGDLRVVTGDGVVVPVTHVAPTLQEPRFRPIASVGIEDAARALGPAATECIIEFDTTPLLGRDLAVGFTHMAHRRGARYEAQTRGTTWRPVRAALVDDPEDPLGGLVVGFHETTFRRLRVIVDRQESNSGDRVFVGHQEHADTPREPIPFRERASTFDRRVYRMEVAIDGAARAVGKLVLSSPGGFKPLDVGVEIEREGGGWRVMGIDTRTLPDNRLEISWPPRRTGALRIEVRRADPPNVPVRLESVSAIPRRFRFFSSAESPARWVTYGDDFMATRTRTAPPAISVHPLVVAALGEPEGNPWYGGEPGGLEWVRRQGWVIPTAMLAVLALVGWMTFTGRPVENSDPAH